MTDDITRIIEKYKTIADLDFEDHFDDIAGDVQLLGGALGNTSDEKLKNDIKIILRTILEFTQNQAIHLQQTMEESLNKADQITKMSEACIAYMKPDRKT